MLFTIYDIIYLCFTIKGGKLMDISLMINDTKFNFRVGAIFKYKNQILTERGDGASFSVIPDGRVKIMEDTNMALNREIKEELGIDISRLDHELVSIIENFFVFNNVQHHELYFVYMYDLSNDFGIKDGMTNLDTQKAKYYWKKIDDLDNAVILPSKVKELVKVDGFKRYVVKD